MQKRVFSLPFTSGRHRPSESAFTLMVPGPNPSKGRRHGGRQPVCVGSVAAHAGSTEPRGGDRLGFPAGGNPLPGQILTVQVLRNQTE